MRFRLSVNALMTFLTHSVLLPIAINTLAVIERLVAMSPRDFPGDIRWAFEGIARHTFVCLFYVALLTFAIMERGTTQLSLLQHREFWAIEAFRRGRIDIFFAAHAITCLPVFFITARCTRERVKRYKELQLPPVRIILDPATFQNPYHSQSSTSQAHVPLSIKYLFT